MNEKQQIIMTVGLPASGKSTWAIKKVQESNGHFKRVEKDLIREMIQGPEGRPKEPLVLDIQNRTIKALLDAGHSVIVADTNLKKYHLDRLLKIAEKYDIELSIESFLGMSVERLIRRNENRPDKVPMEVIYSMNILASETEAWIRDYRVEKYL